MEKKQTEASETDYERGRKRSVNYPYQDSVNVAKRRVNGSALDTYLRNRMINMQRDKAHNVQSNIGMLSSNVHGVKNQVVGDSTPRRPPVMTDVTNIVRDSTSKRPLVMSDITNSVGSHVDKQGKQTKQLENQIADITTTRGSQCQSNNNVNHAFSSQTTPLSCISNLSAKTPLTPMDKMIRRIDFPKHTTQGKGLKSSEHITNSNQENVDPQSQIIYPSNYQNYQTPTNGQGSNSSQGISKSHVNSHKGKAIRLGIPNDSKKTGSRSKKSVRISSFVKSNIIISDGKQYTKKDNNNINANDGNVHVEPSSSGTKNLLDSFNDVDEAFEYNDEAFDESYMDFAEESDIDIWEGYQTLGGPDALCSKCGAVMWNMERNNKSNKNAMPTFSLCCKNGQVELPKERHPPEPLASLLHNSPHFRLNIRVYNCMFAMCSSGGKIDHRINNGRAPYCFKVRGQNLHFIGSLLPLEGETPKFCQLYIYDTENELPNRLNAIGEVRDQVDHTIVDALMRMLHEHNKVVAQFLTARERFKDNELDEFRLVLISSESASGRSNIIGPSNEVGGLIVNKNEDTPGFRDTIVQTRQNVLKRVWETDLFFMQLQYPILFPHGEDGFHTKIPLKNIKKQKRISVEDDNEDEEKKYREFVSMKEYYCYKLMIRLTEGLTPHLGGRLWQQYVVDAFTAIEQYRLDWISRNQTTIRSDLYTSVRDAIKKGDNDPNHVGKCIILPASFTGSKRYMSQYFKDSLALCRVIGHPTLFLTMTCNSKWPEIKEMMKHLPNVDVCDAPDIVARVFKMKLEQLIDLIKKKNYFGRCIGIMHVIEFQKRGLPHAHMLIWLHPDDRPKNVEQIDALVSAEIPDKNIDPVGYAAVKNYMIHGPCGQDFTYSPCMVKGKCMRHFPKRYNGNTCFDDSGFPVYRRRKTGAHVKVKGALLDNQYVVPFNRDLLVRFQCHINLEICNNSRSLKYLFKYCLKGHDNATMMLKKKNGPASLNTTRNEQKSLDEVKHYLDGRYVCASEASWRIFGFDIHSRWPSVDRLPVHLPDSKYVSFKTGESLQKVCDRAISKRSKLEAWFLANKEIPTARQYTYSEFPSHFTWLPRECKWRLRQRGDVVGRLSEVHATAGDLLYLRMLLMRKKGCLSFEDVRNVDGHVYDSFKETCRALGLLEDDRQWHEALLENANSSFPNQLREMFVNILAYCSVSDPLSLWNEHWRCMSDDILHNRRRLTGNNDLQLSDSDVQNYALAEIEKLMNDIGKSLKDYPTMPFPPDIFRCTDLNRLIIEETGYDKAEMKQKHDVNYGKLNVEQKKVYHSVIDSVENDKGGLFFVYGSGGCGKTFLWQTICCRLRSELKIVLPVASSGIAAVLLPGGRTAHSRFHIPLKLDQYSTAGIKHGTEIAELLQHTSLIIWDEAPMQHRHAFECVDRSLRDIMSSIDPVRSRKPFGGITVVFGGDFRQILPVIPKATRAEIVGASLNKSRLWDHCQVFLLKQNMRLHSGNSPQQNEIIKQFSEWQLKVGDGKLDNGIQADNQSSAHLKIPDEFVVRCSEKPIETLCDIVYPNFVENMSSHTYLRSRAILTPTNAVVDDINSVLIDKIPGTTHIYLSQDSIEDSGVDENEFDEAFPVEYLNSINMPCLPKHELKIKVGSVVMLMRNLNQILGLCNGTRMVVTACKKNSIECQILYGSNVGRKHLIPRIDMVPTDTKWPFEFKRTQFPLQLCFAMTVNKSQGQSLDTVGLYLPKSVFCHGQLYVAISRVTSPKGLYILIDSDDGLSTNVTENVVFEEVFYNLPTLD